MKEPMYYCPVCANVILDSLLESCKEKHLQVEKMECVYCGDKLMSTNEDVKYFARYGYDNNIFYFDAVREIYVYNNPLFDKTKSDERVAAEDAHQAEMDQIHRNVEARKANNGTPKCPICQSTNLSKISTGGKVAKVAMLGIFGMGDNGKTWKCNSCGSRF